MAFFGMAFDFFEQLFTVLLIGVLILIAGVALLFVVRIFTGMADKMQVGRPYKWRRRDGNSS